MTVERVAMTETRAVVQRTLRFLADGDLLAHAADAEWMRRVADRMDSQAPWEPCPLCEETARCAPACPLGGVSAIDPDPLAKSWMIRALRDEESSHGQAEAELHRTIEFERSERVIAQGRAERLSAALNAVFGVVDRLRAEGPP